MIQIKEYDEAFIVKSIYALRHCIMNSQIPLQIRMAEIFQENIEEMGTESNKEYIIGNEAISKLPDKFNIADLFR